MDDQGMQFADPAWRPAQERASNAAPQNHEPSIPLPIKDSVDTRQQGPSASAQTPSEQSSSDTSYAGYRGDQAPPLNRTSQDGLPLESPQPAQPSRVSRRTFLIGATIASAIAAIGGSVFTVLLQHVAPQPVPAPAPPPNLADPTRVTTLSDDGMGSLRWALANAPAGSTITFDASLKGTILRPSSQQCRDLLIGKSLTIRGPGARVLAVSGSGHDRVFTVSSGVSVTISNLTIENGTQGCAGYPGGGGIYNEGTLTLSNCTISNNTMPDGQGGGIDNEGTLTLINCTVSGNSGSGGQNMRGGGIYNGIVNNRMGNGSQLTLINSTVSGNTATGGYGDSGFGGGIYNAAGSKLTLNNSTVSGNAATGPNSKGGGIFNEGTLMLLHNSAVSGNSASAGGNDIYNQGTLSYG